VASRVGSVAGRKRGVDTVASHGERVTSEGLVFAATPANHFICGTQQLASMNLHVFTTAKQPLWRGAGNVVKVSSRTALAERWPDLIELDAGRIATGKSTITQVGWELFHLILDVASGRKKTWADHWGLHNAEAGTSQARSQAQDHGDHPQCRILSPCRPVPKPDFARVFSSGVV
jgi:altronate dehydratase